VYCRVARGEFVFDDDFEAPKFIEVLRKVRDLDGWTILGWCLMGNHYHLVVKTRNVDLWRSMARLQGTVARSYNRRHRFLGRLWQSRYRARVIDTDDYFRQVVSYVHLNPVSAGVVDDPAEYPYCGHREVLGLCQPYVIDRCSVLRAFGGENARDLANKYLHWVRSFAESRWAIVGISELPWWTKPSRIDEIADVDRHANATTFDGQALAEDRAGLELNDFALGFEAASGHTLSDLASRCRSSSQTLGRIEFSTLAIARYGFRVCDVAALIRKHRNSVTKWLNQGLRQEGSHSDFAKRLDHLDAAISRRT
jgi:REP element-mobilizing transposase RayT